MLQHTIRDFFTTQRPVAPKLRIKNVTQTSCVLEWLDIGIGNSLLHNLSLWKDSSKIGMIPNPTENKMTKLSGLSVDTNYKFYLVLRTSAGTLRSNEVDLRTLKLTDLSGLRIAIAPGKISEEKKSEIAKALQRMGCEPAGTGIFYFNFWIFVFCQF